MRLGDAWFVYPGRIPWIVTAHFCAVPEELRRRRPAKKEPLRVVVLVDGQLAAAVAPELDRDVQQILQKAAAREGVELITGFTEELPPSGLQVVPAEPSGVALSAEELSLLQALYTRNGIELTTPAYELAGLHYAVGDACRQKLLKLDFITATRITPSSGKGKSGKALSISALGYERLGLKPPRRTRGAGPQSEYLCQRLHELIPDSHLELALGADKETGSLGKAPDLCFRFHPVKHAAFLLALQEHGRLYAELDDMSVPDDTLTTIPEGWLVGVEVECATDTSNLTRSIFRNLDRDAAAGIQFLVIGTTPKMLSRAKKDLDSRDNLASLVLIDVLKLLDHLRGDKSDA